MVTKEQVTNALRSIHSIKASTNVVDFGLVEEISINNNSVHVKMRAILRPCPYNFVLAVKGEKEIKKIKGVKDAEVEVLFQKHRTSQ